MSARNKVTSSQRPTAPRPTPAERRAAQIERLSTRQAELKQEAAERRLKRSEGKDPSPAPAAPKQAARASDAH